MSQKADSYLTWISDDALELAVSNVYQAMFNAMQSTSLRDMQTQVIDPFSVLFETITTGTTTDDWLEREAQRQAQRSWINQIGYFHQEVLGSVNGWSDLGTGDETELDIKKMTTLFLLR